MPVPLPRALAALAVATTLVGLAALPATAADAARQPGSVQPGAAGSGVAGRQARAASTATALLEADRSALGASPADAFRLRGTPLLDPDGSAHVRYDRLHEGLPVLGGDLVVHVTPGGGLRGVSTGGSGAGLDGDLAGLSTSPAVPADRALQLARGAAAATGRSTSAASGRLVVDALSGRPALAHEVVVTGVQADQTPSRLHVLVDAATGAVRRSWDEVETGTGTSLYEGKVSFPTSRTTSTGPYAMTDPARPGATTTDLRGGTSGGGSVFTDGDDVWGNGATSDRASAAVDASYGAQRTFAFYRDVLGRNGIYDNGAGVRSRVHYGSGYANAFWDGQQMTYGDGAGNAHPLVSLDITGHEMSHGVTENTAGLVYSGESGGLDEATSDILGTAVEFAAADPADPGDYLIGEQLGTPLRYLDRPSRDGHSKDCWSPGLASLDVHYSSGPANHVFYLLSEGSGAKTVNGVAYSSPTCNGSTVAAIGRNAAVRIWYRALSTYMTSSTDYTGARRAAVQAAIDLYGAGSARCAGVEKAFAAVNVAGATCTEPAPPVGNLVTNPGFESGSSGWTQSGALVSDDATRAHAGSWEAWLGGYATAHTDTLTQTVTVPAAGAASLAFWLRVDTLEPGSVPYDTLKVQVLKGTRRTTLALYSNADASGYTPHALDLSAYAGSTVTLTFLATEDASNVTSFLVDDVAVTTSGPPAR